MGIWVARRTVLLAVLMALAFPISAAALDGGHGAWVPGALLVRFNDGVSAPVRARIAARDGVTLRYRLPLVPNLWEATTDGRVPAATGALERSRAVDYAQPDYLDQVSLDASPSQAAYWPNDPYFWPLKWSNENRCTLEPSCGLPSSATSRRADPVTSSLACGSRSACCACPRRVRCSAPWP